jgi:hypothetical protein
LDIAACVRVSGGSLNPTDAGALQSSSLLLLLLQDYAERVLPSIIQETLKSVVAQYNASQLITMREVRVVRGRRGIPRPLRMGGKGRKGGGGQGGIAYWPALRGVLGQNTWPLGFWGKEVR